MLAPAFDHNFQFEPILLYLSGRPVYYESYIYISGVALNTIFSARLHGKRI